MSQKANSEGDENILPEYDFTNAVRGKHHEAYKAGTNVVFLEPDIAKVFKDSKRRQRWQAPAWIGARPLSRILW